MTIKELILDRLDEPVSSFCKKVKVNRTTINDIINDKYNHELRLVTIKKICKYFKVDWKDFV